MITVLHYRIERARTKLHELSEEYGGFMHPKVLVQSMILDELINKVLSRKNEEKPIVGSDRLWRVTWSGHLAS